MSPMGSRGGLHLPWRCRRSAAPKLFLLLTFLGCTERGEKLGVERSRAGDTVVVHSHRPEYRDTLEMLEILRIGETDGPEGYTFSYIRSFAVGPDGDILISDGDGIRRFRADGIFLDWVAHAGEGPWEVDAVGAMDVSLHGVVAAQDVGNSRISIFYSADSVSHVRGPAGRPAFSDEDALRFHPDGTLWVKLHPAWPPPGGITHPRAIYARVDVAKNALLDTVYTPADAATDCPTLTEHPYSQGGWQDTREPWIPLTMWAWGPDGTFALGCPAAYEFTVVRTTGEVLKISRDWTPVQEVPEAIKFMEMGGDLKDLPATLPAYSQIIVPGDERVWAWPTQPSRRVPARQLVVEVLGVTEEWVRPIAGAFDVFGSDGSWLGVVKPPTGVEYSGFITSNPVLIRGDTIWAVAKDALDVNYLVRSEIVWPKRNETEE